MVNKIVRLLNKEFHGINEAALLLGFLTLCSQLLGLVRDRMLARFVGVGPSLDVYYASFRVPDFLYVSIASLVSITALMPFMVNKINNDNKNNTEAKNFINNTFSAYIIFMVFISLVIWILMPFIAPKIAPGFSDDKINTLVNLSRIMLFSPIFIGLSNLFGTVTQYFRNFLIFSLSPIFYNIGVLIGIIFIYPSNGIKGLAFGVILGAFLHFIIQIPVIIKHNFIPHFHFNINWAEIFKVIKVSIPRTLALSCNGLIFIFLIAMASNIEPGSISLFTFAYNLQSVPVGIIGISYSVAAFPILVKSFSIKDMDNFINQISIATKQIIFWSLPVIALLSVLRAQIVRVILGSNSFSWVDTRLTAASVALFVISLITQGLVLLFVRGYYATGNTKKPLIVNVFSSIMVIVIANMLLFVFNNYPIVLEKLEIILRVKGVSGTNMFALPMAYATGSIINFFLIWILFKKDFIKDRKLGISKTFYESLLGAITMGAVAYGFLGVFDGIFNINTGVGIFLQGFLSGMLGITSGIIVLILLKNQELADLIKALRNKFWRNRVIAPEQGEL